MGILVQPIVGSLSDKTWCRFGRRIPYLFIGATLAVLVMCLLPNAGSLGLTVGGALLFGLIALMFLDTSINMAMQPFKMLVGDMVNERQKAKAYSIQSFLCNAGFVMGYIFPFPIHLSGHQKRSRERCCARFCYLVVLYWRRMGSHARHAVYFRHQCTSRLWSHGCIPWIIQRDHLYSTDCRSIVRWSFVASGRFTPKQHDGCSRYFTRLWCRFCVFDRQKGSVSNANVCTS